MTLLKRIAAHLPPHHQTAMKRIHFGRQIAKGTFYPDEPEYALLDAILSSGDWVIDIGANVGHYTKKFSDLVGPRGRVIAIEPVPTTFSLLAANVNCFKNSNVTLLNAAVSDKLDVVGMSIPTFSTGLTNYYQAHLDNSALDSGLSVMTMPVDSLNIGHKVALVKIDTEGHEAVVLSGMKKLISTHRPFLIIETDSEKIVSDLSDDGYTPRRLPGSPNIFFRPAG